MMEPSAIVFCLQRDKQVVEEVLDSCKQEYERLTQEQLGEKKEIKLRITETNFLQERDLPDLTSIDVANISDDQEQHIRLNNKEDDKYWLAN